MTWEVLPIPVSGITGDIRIMGLATRPDGLLAVAGSKDQAFLATFDRQLDQTGWYELPGAADPHGLLNEETQLWIVSSGTNEVIRYNMTSSGPADPEKIFGYHLDKPQHFNGIAKHGGSLVLSAFGVSASEARFTSKTGYILDLQSGKPIRTGLDQPHSPVSHNGTLMFCESQSSIFWRGVSAITRLEGYLRGLAVASDGIIHIARSVARPPREDLTVNRPAASIWSVGSDGHVLACDAMTGFGAEVYDLIALPDEWPDG